MMKRQITALVMTDGCCLKKIMYLPFIYTWIVKVLAAVGLFSDAIFLGQNGF